MIPRTIVRNLDPNSAAKKAGLQIGDEILSVQGGGRAGSGFDQILNIIAESKGVPLQFEIRRPASLPRPDASWEELLEGLQTGQHHPADYDHTGGRRTGPRDRRILHGDSHRPRALWTLSGSLVQSVRYNYEIAVITYKVIGRIFTGRASVKTISGPIEIANVAGSAARTGSARLFFSFVGLLSLNLGIFNLLPIPILDGGVIFLLLIETLIGRDLSLRIKEKIVQVGFVFLILLMGFVVINDLLKIPSFNNIFR